MWDSLVATSITCLQDWNASNLKLTCHYDNHVGSPSISGIVWTPLDYRHSHPLWKNAMLLTKLTDVINVWNNIRKEKNTIRKRQQPHIGDILVTSASMERQHGLQFRAPFWKYHSLSHSGKLSWCPPKTRQFLSNEIDAWACFLRLIVPKLTYQHTFVTNRLCHKNMMMRRFVSIRVY